MVCLTGQQTPQTWTPYSIYRYCQEENEKQETKKKNNADELKATVKEKINILSRRPTIHKKIHFIGLIKYSNLLR